MLTPCVARCGPAKAPPCWRPIPPAAGARSSVLPALAADSLLGVGQPALFVGGARSVACSAATGDPLAALQTNVDTLEFGRVYWIKIAGDASVVPYLAPPRILPNGELPGSG